MSDILVIKNLHKSFEGRTILNNICLEVKTGETLGILGLSGSGKSTLIRCIVQLLRADSGSIWFLGQNLMALSETELLNIRQKIGFLFQDGALFDSKNVFENVAFPLREHTKDNEPTIRKKVFERLELVGLKPDIVYKQFPSELSGGMRKRVSLARASILDPKILFYDEPTSGLDPLTSHKITQMILSFQKNLGMSSILISHDLLEMFKASNRIAFLHQGNILVCEDVKTFKQSPCKELQEILQVLNLN